MRISSVGCFLLSCPLPEPLCIPFPGGQRIIRKRDALVVRVAADNGLIGYAPGPADDAALEDVHRMVAPFLEGRELQDADALRVLFQEGPGREPHTGRVYGAVEMALFDLLGKAHKIPVSELLGGRVRDRVRVYASGGCHAAPEHFAEEAYRLSRQGFRAYAMRAGMGPDRDGQAVDLIRRSAGAGFDLMVDAEAWWRAGPGLYGRERQDELMAELGSLGVAWVGDPLPPGDHAGYRALRERDLAPIAAGQYEPDDFGLLDLIFNQGVDYVQMNIAAQAGYWAARRILPEVIHAGHRFVFQGCSNPLEVAVAAQLAVCWPEMVAEWIEYPFDLDGAFPLSAEIVKHPLEIVEGSVVAPRSPGLGVEIDEGVFSRYPWIPGRASYFEGFDRKSRDGKS
jgi:D-galactarolactone cycloisomerase